MFSIHTGEGHLAADPEELFANKGTDQQRSFYKVVVIENTRRPNKITNEWETVGSQKFELFLHGTRGRAVFEQVKKGDLVFFGGEFRIEDRKHLGNVYHTLQLTNATLGVIPQLAKDTTDLDDMVDYYEPAIIS